MVRNKSATPTPPKANKILSIVMSSRLCVKLMTRGATNKITSSGVGEGWG